MKRRRRLLAAAVALTLAAASWAAVRAVLRYAAATESMLDSFPAFAEDDDD